MNRTTWISSALLLSILTSAPLLAQEGRLQTEPSLTSQAPTTQYGAARLQTGQSIGSQEPSVVTRTINRLMGRPAVASSVGQVEGGRFAYSPSAVTLFSDRPRLGISIDQTADEGVEISEVYPDSPAQAAGLEAGDLITHWNGDSLADKDLGYVSQRARELKDGQVVRLTYERDNQSVEVELTARTMPGAMASFPAVTWSPPDASRGRFGPGSLFPTLLGSWNDLEMIPLSDDLGAYFGTTEGLLVLTPPSTNPFELKAGDVLQTIGDRKPRDAPHFVRVLRSYEPGEMIRLHVLRHRESIVLEAPAEGSRQALTGTLFHRRAI